MNFATLLSTFSLKSGSKEKLKSNNSKKLPKLWLVSLFSLFPLKAKPCLDKNVQLE